MALSAFEKASIVGVRCILRMLTSWSFDARKVLPHYAFLNYQQVIHVFGLYVEDKDSVDSQTR